MLLFIYTFHRNRSDSLCFNTSHVTLYRLHLHEPNLLFRVSIHLMLLFIWIMEKSAHLDLSFNTSHVTLYQHRGYSKQKIQSCFNTSHVTLYPDLMQLIHSFTKVSIHLMLLFIIQCKNTDSYCFCVSIHLMLLFIYVW